MTEKSENSAGLLCCKETALHGPPWIHVPLRHARHAPAPRSQNQLESSHKAWKKMNWKTNSRKVSQRIRECMNVLDKLYVQHCKTESGSSFDAHLWDVIECRLCERKCTLCQHETPCDTCLQANQNTSPT